MLILSPRKGNIILVPYKDEEITLELEAKGSTISAKGKETAGGIFVVSEASHMTVKDKNTSVGEGVVVSIGPEVEGIEVGWRVVYNFHSGRNFVFDGAEYIKVHEAEVFAVVTQSK